MCPAIRKRGVSKPLGTPPVLPQLRNAVFGFFAVILPDQCSSILFRIARWIEASRSCYSEMFPCIFNSSPCHCNAGACHSTIPIGEQISDRLPNARTIIDGEICSLDRRGRPQFKNLMFRRGNPPCFFAFDLLIHDGKDLRTERLLDRKQELRRLL